MKVREFEGKLSRLEKIVGNLEGGDLSLEEALKLFEEGVQVSRYCARVLKEAERKVEILTRNKEGEMEAGPFQLSEQKEN